MNAVTTTEAHEIQALPQSPGPDSATLMRIIEMSMSRQDFDIAKVSALLEIKERWEASEARKAFVLAMSLFKSEPMEIFKRKLVEFTTRDAGVTRYSHADLSDITDVISPAMAKHGLSFRWDVRQKDGAVHVDCIVRHAQGHSETTTMVAAPDASGKKNAIQQVASAVTYLERYTLLAAAGMATKDMDDDGQASGEPSEEQTTLLSAIRVHKTDDEALKFWNERKADFASNKIMYDWFKEAVAAHRLELREAQS